MSRHPCFEDRWIDRFCHVIRCAQFESLRFISGLVHCGQKNNRDIPGQFIFLKPPANLIAVHIRHHDIQKNKVGRFLIGDLKGHRATGGCFDDVVVTENAFDDVEVFGRVVNREYGEFFSHVRHCLMLARRTAGSIGLVM